MPWYTYILLLFFGLSCLILVGVVLLQSGKGGDMSSALGGGSGGQNAFGARTGNSTLAKITMGAAVSYMILAFVFTLPGVMSGGSVASGIKDEPVIPKPISSPAPKVSPSPTQNPVANPTTDKVPLEDSKPVEDGKAAPEAKPSETVKPVATEKPADKAADKAKGTSEKPSEAKPAESKPVNK